MNAARISATGIHIFLEPPRLLRIWLSNQLMMRSRATAMTMRTPVAARIRGISEIRMAWVMTPPRPPPPTKAANTAVPMAFTTAMRMPVNTVGKARGNSTISTR